MKDVKTVEYEEVTETEVEEVKKTGFLTKIGTGIKKNAKKVAIGAAGCVVGLIVGYGIGKNSSDDNNYEDDGSDVIDVTDYSEENTGNE